MLEPDTIVRIKTLEEITKEHPEVEMRNVIQKWQNRICVIDWFRTVVPTQPGSKYAQRQYRLSFCDKSINPEDDVFDKQTIDSFLWFDYEVEPYDQPDIQEEIYLNIIGGAG